MYILYFFILILIIFAYTSFESLLLLYNMNYNKEKSHYKAFQKTIKTVLWIGYLMIYQKVYKNLVQIEKNVYEIHYIYHGQLYKIKCINPIGPKQTQVLMITNDNLDDISNEIMPYMGPKQNFHNLKYRPVDFKQKELCFYLSNGEILTIKNNDEIKFN